MTYVGGGTADDYTFVDDSQLDLEQWDTEGLGLFDFNSVPSVVSP